MTNPNHTDTSRSGDLVEEMRDLANAFGDDVKRRYSQDLLREAADRIEAIEAENERLREALELADAAAAVIEADRAELVAEIVAELRSVGSMPAQIYADHIEAKFGGRDG